MGTKNNTKYSTIKIGDVFGDWLVVGEVFMDTYAKIPCKCKCGFQANVDAYTVIVGRSKSCKICSLPRNGSNNPSWKGHEEIPSSWFNRFKRYAKSDFQITIEDVWNLYIEQDRKCKLTGLPISFVNEYIRGDKYNGVKCTASIDRIDSSKGYLLDNIQLVHKDVNIMKNSFDQDYFISLCKLITTIY
jgi:hypothetical protein